MAKLSHDNTSWRANGLVRRYEDWENNSKLDKNKKNRKNTKQWCKGRVGVEHQIRSVNIGVMNCWECRKAHKQCIHTRHIDKCVVCNMPFKYRRPVKANEVKVAGVATEQELLAKKWCTEGHLWDWTKFENPAQRYTWNTGIHDNYLFRDNQIMVRRVDHNGNVYYAKPWRMPRVHKICVMCNLERRSQSREITPEDL